MTVHENVSPQAGLASFRHWEPDHKTFLEDALAREDLPLGPVDPPTWTDEFLAENWAHRQEKGEMNDNTRYEESTLEKVYEGLAAAGVVGQPAIDAVNQMQNRGILFRERVS